MIKIFPGDDGPEELAEGALVLIQGDTPYLSFTRPGRALAMQKGANRFVMYDLLDPSRMGAEYLTLETYECNNLYWTSRVSAVCDTLAEVNRLVRSSEEARQKMAAFVAELEIEQVALDGETLADHA